jgi:hypothetical protein
MLEEVQELKILVVQAMLYGSDTEKQTVNVLIDTFMAKNRLQILDVLYDVLSGEVQR